MRTKLSVVALAIVAALTTGAAHAVPLPKPRPHIVVVDTPEKCAARVMYGEFRNKSKLAQLMAGNSLRRRAELNRQDFGGSRICDVAYHKVIKGKYLRRQYSSLTDNGVFAPKELRAWEASLEAARQLKDFHPKWPWSEAIYYLEPKHSDRPGNKWAHSLAAVGWLADHLWARDPDPPVPLPKPRPTIVTVIAHR